MERPQGTPQQRAHICASALETVLAAYPTASVDSISAAFDAAAPRVETLKRLSRQVLRRPDELVHPTGAMSRLVYRLLIELQRLDVAGLPPLRCVGCGRDDVVLERAHPEGRQCNRCYERVRRERCLLCGRDRRVYRRTAEGPVCQTCAATDESTWRECAVCGEVRRVNQHRSDGPICLRCYKRQAARSSIRGSARDRRAARVAMVMDQVCSLDPHAGETATKEAIERVASADNRLASLAAYLTEHPGALGRGDNRAPVVVADLIATLAETGVSGLVAPACQHCGDVKRLPHPRENGHRICGNCLRKANTHPCSECGRVRPVGKRLDEDTVLCAHCYHKRKPHHPCSQCGRLKPAADHGGPGGGPRCSGCRRRDRTTWEACGSCGTRAPVASRDKATREALCANCYQPPTSRCDLCGRTEEIRSKRGGLTICVKCYRGRWEACALCAQTTWCYSHAGAVTCLRCILTAQLTDLVAGPEAGRPSGWEPLAVVIQQAPVPRTQLRWLRHSEGAQVVRRLASHGVAPSHEALDEAAGDRGGAAAAIEHLRSLLVVSGSIPERDNPLARLRADLQRLVDTAAPTDRSILDRYARWRVLAAARRQAERGGLSHGRRYASRHQVVVAARFLQWLHESDSDLGTCSQGQLDMYLSEAPTQRRPLLRFLRWARRQRLAPTALTIPTDTYSAPRRREPEGAREDQLRRALTESGWSPRERAAASLVLLYGMNPSRIVALRRTDLHVDGDSMALTIGRTPIDLPPRVAGILARLPENRRDGAHSGDQADPELWLFPGDRRGQHMDPTTLGRLLHMRGIQPRTARNTTLSDLAADVPAPVLIHLLGINAATAEAWRSTSGHGPQYAALRPERRQPAGGAS